MVKWLRNRLGVPQCTPRIVCEVAGGTTCDFLQRKDAPKPSTDHHDVVLESVERLERNESLRIFLHSKQMRASFHWAFSTRDKRGEGTTSGRPKKGNDYRTHSRAMGSAQWVNAVSACRKRVSKYKV